MKGDFSQAAFDPELYSRVLVQQGRVQLDADWNEQQAILDYRMRTVLGDVFGHGDLVARAVVPEASPGFGVHVHTGRTFETGDVPSITAALDASKPFSFEAWVRPSSDHGGTRRTIATAYTTGDSKMVARLSLDRLGCATFEFVDDEANLQRLTSTRAVRDDGYSHVAGLFSGDAIEIWIDGAFDRRAAARGAAHQHVVLYIGGSSVQPSVDERFDGAIESVSLYHGRRFDADFNDIYLRRHSFPIPRDERVTAHWRASEGADGTLRRELCLGPGRCYVGGMLCSSLAHRSLVIPSAAGEQRFLVFIDVWERYLSAFEEPSLRDPALGGLDTAGRLRTMANSAIVPMEHDAEAMLDFLAALEHDRAQILVDLGEARLQDNQLYRFEVHAGGPSATRSNPSDAVVVELLPPDDSASAGDRRKLRAASAVSATWECGQFLQRIDEAGKPTFTILQLTSSPEQDGGEACMFVDSVPAGLSGSIRVRPIASVLWSKDNAHAVFGIDRVAAVAADSTTIDLFDEAGRSSLLNPGDVVVVTWEQRIEAFQPGVVTTIKTLSTDVPGTISVVLPVPIAQLGARATLRRWDGLLPALALNGGAPSSAGDLTVRFSDTGVFRPGDYWLARVRPDADTPLEWRYDVRRAATFSPPFGIAHVYGPLAFLEVDGEQIHVTYDLRHISRPAADSDKELRDALRAFIEGGAPHHQHHEHHEPEAHVPTIHERVVQIVEKLPPDVLVLGRRAHDRSSVAGVIEARVEHPKWMPFGAAAQGGPAQAVALGNHIYTLFADGALWRFESGAVRGWVQCSRLPVAIEWPTLCAAGGKLFTLGGSDARSRVLRDVYAYDPATDTWAAQAPMRKNRVHAAAVGDGKRILVFGGERRTVFGFRYLSRSIEEYSIEDDRWQVREPMPFRRSRAAAVGSGTTIFLVGGRITTELFRRAFATGLIHRYARRSMVLDDAELSEPRVAARAVVMGNSLLVAGDGSGMERIDLATGETSVVATKARDDFGFAALHGSVYAIAGLRNGAPLEDVQVCSLIDRFYVHRPSNEGDM